MKFNLVFYSFQFVVAGFLCWWCDDRCGRTDGRTDGVLMTCLHGRRSRARPLFLTLLTCFFTVWTLDRTSPICAGQPHLNAPTSNGIYTKRPLIVQSTGLFFLPFPLASVYSTDITPKFWNFFDSDWKTFFRYFSRERWKVVQSCVRFTAARRNKGPSASWFRHTREKRMGWLWLGV